MMHGVDTARPARAGATAGLLFCALAAGEHTSLAQVGGRTGAWTHLGSTSARNALTRHPPPDLAQPAWTRATGQAGSTLLFPWQASPAVDEHSVYVVARTTGPSRAWLLAVHRDSGGIRWQTQLPALPAFDSQSCPVIDQEHGTVIVGVGRLLVAYRRSDGWEAWRTNLDQFVVNASAAVTGDRGRADRAFITDYPFDAGSEGRLYCINVDPTHPTHNPYAPGDIVWSVTLEGTSGNSPAYLPRHLGGDGRVYVANYGVYGVTPGTIRAFDPDAQQAAVPVWEAINPEPQGYFGGLTIVPRGPSGVAEIFAASYAFFGGPSCEPGGGPESANLLRLNARTGAIIAGSPSNRSSSMAVYSPAGRLVLAGGYHLPSVGGAVSVAMFDAALGASSRVWDSALAGWTDANFNCLLDAGEYTLLGGYLNQPVVSHFAGRTRIIAGAMPTAALTQPGTSVSVLNALAPVWSPGFVESSGASAGSSPAVAGGSVYATGSAGVVALGLTPQSYDVDGSLRVGIDDLYEWEVGTGLLDVNGDLLADASDRAALVTLLRATEPEELAEAAR